jgi:hypothetical protein
MPNMTLERDSQIRQLLEAFAKYDVKPIRGGSDLYYRLTYYWAVDDDDDRYLSLTTSLTSLDLVLLYRDHQQVETKVLNHVDAVIDWLLIHLRRLAKNSASPHAQALKFGVRSPSE